MKSQRIRDRLAELSRFTGASGLKDPAGWQQVLYEFLFEALGYSKNKEQMLKLAGIVKLEIIRKRAVNLDIIDIQSLLFGVSGLLFDIRLKDDYITEIKEGWNLLKEDINIPLMQKSEWLFFRMRPQNFPTIRIACGAQLAGKILNQKLLKNIILSFKSKLFDARKCYEHISLLLTPEQDNYWSYHYNFGKLSSSPNTLLGQERLADIIVNVIIPLVFLYSNEFDDETIKNNVLELYHSLKLQTKNSVIKMMISQLPAGKVKSTIASAQQALLQLYNFYCVRERCGECEIGRSAAKEEAFNYRIIFY